MLGVPHLDDGEEVCVLHGLHGGEPLLVVVAQKVVEELKQQVSARTAELEKERQEKAMFHLQKVGLADWSTHLPNELSGGQKQRVAIARALAAEPKLLLADEPTGALDSTTSQEIMQFLQQLNDEGKTILIVTHEEDISLMCKRIVRLKDGVIMEDKKIKQNRLV